MINNYINLFDDVDDFDSDDSNDDIIIRDRSTDYNVDDDPIDKIDIRLK